MRPTPYLHLETRFKRVHVLRSITHLLRWDQEVMMPTGSASIRADQLALLDMECSSILHSKRLAHLLDRAETAEANLSDWQRANLREMRRIWQRSNAIPKRLLNSLHRATTRAEVCWRRAYQEDNFNLLVPLQERVLDVVREKARLLGERLNCAPYDALIDEYDPGRETREIDSLFMALERGLPPIIDLAVEAQASRPFTLHESKISIARQRDLGKKLMKCMGFPFVKGRLDESLHPFTEGTSEDLRITSKFSELDFMTGLMGVLHETGHAMYDFGLPAEWFFQPVGRDRGMTLHEGMALFIEMMIGRSREFMEFAAPWARRILGVSGPAWEAENMYRQATRVRKSLIRMDADEVTYSIHILIRYELEKDIFSGNLRVRDLPEAWNEKYRQHLGRAPETASEGCLQDSHWPMAYFGYFPTYALGAITASQILSVITRELPDVFDSIRNGDFSGLFDSLGRRVYALGSRFTNRELIEQSTGENLNPDVFLAYLRNKYLPS